MGGSGAVPIFVNTEAGRRNPRMEYAVADAFRNADVAAEVRPTAPTRLAAEIRSAVERGAQIVGVAGGDGSFRTAAGVLAGSATALLPVPAGTLNHFALRMGIGCIEAAARAVASGNTVPVAIGATDGHAFLNSASCGAYAHIVRHRERLRPCLTKWPAAVVATIAVSARLPLLDVVIERDRSRLRQATPMVWIGLGRGSIPLSYQADEGAAGRILEVAVVRVQSRRALFRLMLRAARRFLRGERPDGGRDLEIFHTRRLTLHAPRRIDVTLDGEPGRLAPSLTFTVQNDALRVVTPGERTGVGGPAVP